MTKKIPTSSAELAEDLLDQGTLKELWETPDGLKSYIEGYAENFARADGGELTKQIRNETQAALGEFLKANGQQPTNFKLDVSANGHPDLRGFDSHAAGVFAKARRQSLYNKSAAGAKLDGIFASAGDYLRGLANESFGLRLRGDQKEVAQSFSRVKDIQNAFGTDVASDGGFLVPEAFRSDLLMLALESSLIRSRATVIPMSSQTLAIPTVDDVTHSGGTVFGGIQVYWVDEAQQPTETSAKFAQVKLDAKKLMAYCTAPNELVADGPAFSAFIDQSLPQALAFEEDYRFIQGSGVGEPLGFVNCPAAVIAAGASHLGANTIGVEDLAGMFARMLPSSLMNAIWVADIGTFPQLAVMAVQGAVANSTPVWMNNGVIGAPPATIYGRPVYFTEKVPALGTTGDICFVDPSFYLVGDRQAVSASASPHVAFNVDKTAYKIIERVDGRPWLNSALTPRNGGNTISPFVQLSSTRT